MFCFGFAGRRVAGGFEGTRGIVAGELPFVKHYFDVRMVNGTNARKRITQRSRGR
jgi:hypothetical protein